MDLLVENTVVVELKSIAAIEPVHPKQLLTYLRLSNKPLGLLINFNVPLLKDGITRIINSEATVPTPPLKASGQNSSAPLRTLREKRSRFPS